MGYQGVGGFTALEEAVKAEENLPPYLAMIQWTPHD
jgi:hypothetical protein